MLLTPVLSATIAQGGERAAETEGLAALERSETKYALAAEEVMRHIQAEFYLPDEGLYASSRTRREPEHMWGNGVVFSALLGAARHDAKTYRPVFTRMFASMDRYWDTRVKIPGYEPSPTKGGGNDKYYDDNAWMVLDFIEAFEMTQDRRYLQRAEQTLAFVLSGWDDQRGGGIWWHERHKAGTKNTCVNAPAAVGCLLVARYQPPQRAEESVATAKRIIEWTNETLRNDNGLYGDGIFVESGKLNNDKLTYNTALMIRALLGLHRQTGDARYLEQAKRSAAASDWYLDKRTGAFRDPPKWSHLLVEADLELFRFTRDDHLLRRAIDNADHQYATWKQRRPDTLIENAAIARTLWLLADMQTPSARQFWERVDQAAAAIGKPR